ncbi:MAG: hypothetical protein PVH29_03515 [Candidatus Zixiibacteriota bacterium]|jgi:hypothetical protein
MEKALTPDFLRRKHYQVVSLPGEAVRVFNLLARLNGHYGVVGEVFDLHEEPPRNRPDVHERMDIPEFRAVRTNFGEPGATARFVESMLRASPSPPAAGEAAEVMEESFPEASSLSIEFYDVREVMAHPIDLAIFVEGYGWNGEPEFLREPLDKGHCCIIHGYLESSKLALRGKNGRGRAVRPNPGPVDELFALCPDIWVSEGDGCVVVESERRLPIAVKAIKVKLSKAGCFHLMGPAADIVSWQMKSAGVALPAVEAVMLKFAMNRLFVHESQMDKFTTEDFDAVPVYGEVILGETGLVSG